MRTSHAISILLAAFATSCSGSSTGAAEMDDGGGAGGGATDAAAPRTDAKGGAGGGGTGTGGGGTGGGATDSGSSSWTNVTSNLKFIKTECGNLGFIVAKPEADNLLLGLAQLGVYSSTDGGGSWRAQGTFKNRPTSLIFNPLDPTIMWESGIYGQGAYKSTDNGVTMTALGTLAGADTLGIDFTDPQRQTMIAAEHEASQKLNKTTDGGATWTAIGANLPAGTGFSSAVTISDTNTYLVSTGGWGGGTSALYRSTDGGTTWAVASNNAPGGYPLYASDGTIYWGIDGGLMKSTDKGATWTKTGTNAPGGLRAAHPTELPDKRLITVGKDKTIKLSGDGGATWKTISDPVPIPAAEALGGVTYSAQRKILVAWYSNCWNNLPDDTIWRTSWDHATN